MGLLILFYLSIISIIFNINKSKIYCWNVDCDLRGNCLITLNNSNMSILIFPGYMPIVPEKYRNPIKNNTSATPTVTVVGEESKGVSIQGYLTGSKKYECAGGVYECSGGCCNNGVCSDPIYNCVYKNNVAKIIFLITGFVFLLLVILYWIIFFVLGQIYNSKPRLLKSDNIYSRLNPATNENPPDDKRIYTEQDKLSKYNQENNNLIGNKNQVFSPPKGSLTNSKTVEKNNENEIFSAPKISLTNSKTLEKNNKNEVFSSQNANVYSMKNPNLQNQNTQQFETREYINPPTKKIDYYTSDKPIQNPPIIIKSAMADDMVVEMKKINNENTKENFLDWVLK